MNREHIYEVACYMRRLEEDHTVRIIFESLDSIYGMFYKGHNGKFLMIINKNINYEKQLETIWHEAKHIYSHVNAPGDIQVFEKEAINFGKDAIKYGNEILELCRSAW